MYSLLPFLLLIDFSVCAVPYYSNGTSLSAGTGYGSGTGALTGAPSPTSTVDSTTYLTSFVTVTATRNSSCTINALADLIYWDTTTYTSVTDLCSATNSAYTNSTANATSSTQVATATPSASGVGSHGVAATRILVFETPEPKLITEIDFVSTTTVTATTRTEVVTYPAFTFTRKVPESLRNHAGEAPYTVLPTGIITDPVSSDTYIFTVTQNTLTFTSRSYSQSTPSWGGITSTLHPSITYRGDVYDYEIASKTAYVYASVFQVVRANTTSTVTASVPFFGPFNGDPYEYWDGRTRADGPLLDDVVTQLEYFGVSHISDCVAGSYKGSPTLIVPLTISSDGCHLASPARPQESIDSVPGVVAEPLTVDSADGATRSKPTDGPEVQPPAPGRPQISINTINSPSAVPLPGIATPASPGGPAITAGPAAVFGIPDRPQQRPSPGGNTPESPLPSPGGQETPAPGNEGPGSVESEGVPSQGDQGTPSSDNQGGSQIDTSPGQSQDQPSQPSPQPGPEDQSPAPGDDNPTMPSIPPVVIAPPIHTTITVGGIPVEVSSDQVILPSTTYFPSSGAAPATVTISNTPVVFNPSQIIAGDSTIAIPSQEPETAGLPTIPATPPVYIVGSQTFEVNPASEVVIAGQTVRPGSPGVVVGSQTFSLAPSASAIVVGGETYQLTLPAFPSPTGALATPKITVGGETYTANPAGEFVIGTQTITPGSPAVTISGTPVSVAPQTAPEITFGTHTYTANPAGQFVIGTQTITPGSPAVTISGTPVSVAPQLVTPQITFGTHTYTINPAGQFVIGTQTITPGSPAVTISGTPISIAPQATQIVVGSSTIPQGGGDGGIGGMIMSAFGAGPSQSGSPTSASDTGNGDMVPTGISTDAEASPTVSGNGGGQTGVVGFLPGSGAARWNTLDKWKIWGVGILGLATFIRT